MSASNVLHEWRAIGEEEEAVLEARFAENPNPSSNAKMALALELHVSPQNVGRWFSARKRREAGEARAAKKHPDQVAALERLFAKNPFPTREEKAAVSRETGCTLKQINSWFQHTRKKKNMTNLDNLPGEYLRNWHKETASLIRSAVLATGDDAGQGGKEDASHSDDAEPEHGSPPDEPPRSAGPASASGPRKGRQSRTRTDDDSDSYDDRRSSSRRSARVAQNRAADRYGPYAGDEAASRHRRNGSSASVRSAGSSANSIPPRSHPDPSHHGLEASVPPYADYGSLAAFRAAQSRARAESDMSSASPALESGLPPLVHPLDRAASNFSVSSMARLPSPSPSESASQSAEHESPNLVPRMEQLSTHAPVHAPHPLYPRPPPPGPWSSRPATPGNLLGYVDKHGLVHVRGQTPAGEFPAPHPGMTAIVGPFPAPQLYGGTGEPFAPRAHAFDPASPLTGTPPPLDLRMPSPAMRGGTPPSFHTPSLPLHAYPAGAPIPAAPRLRDSGVYWAPTPDKPFRSASPGENRFAGNAAYTVAVPYPYAGPGQGARPPPGSLAVVPLPPGVPRFG
ncbi:hypothetical protein DFJ74DRAFT_258141 [Hyaloraphidium curvatum]|nr:hypothetical protein DFJ74DRAFT_258141 [Hyaloraphidium curvatum]